ncbi:hypothetical protein J6590_001530 [Homalodisca vitripennis]|nr:hypothetical protein J6590_001530 [Homalodisca vitripennis]
MVNWVKFTCRPYHATVSRNVAPRRASAKHKAAPHLRDFVKDKVVNLPQCTHKVCKYGNRYYCDVCLCKTELKYQNIASEPRLNLYCLRTQSSFS